MAVQHCRLAALKDQIRIFRIKCGDPVVRQIPREALRPRVGAGQKDDPVIALPVFFQIRKEHLEAGIIGVHGLHLQRAGIGDRKALRLHLQHRQRDAPPPVQLRQHRRGRGDLRHFLLIICSLGDAVLHALAEFLLHGVHRLADAPGPVQEKDALFPGEPLEEPAGLPQIVPGRIDRELGDLLHRALGFRIEGPHRIDLVPEKFHPHRPLLREGPQIHDIPAEGELARERDFGAALVSEKDEALFQFLEVELLPALEKEDLPVHLVGRRHPVHERRRRKDGHGVFLLKKGAEHCHALLVQQVAGHIRLVEEQVLRGVQLRIRLIEPQILAEGLRGQIIFRDHHHRRRVVREPVNELRLLRLHAARHGQHAAKRPHPFP